MAIFAQAETILPNGSSQPILGRDANGDQWALKWIGNPQGNKAVVNELVAGRLAKWFGLPWPEVEIMEISGKALAWMEGKGLQVGDNVGVATRFNPFLKSVCWPPGGYGDLRTFSTRNRAHILSLFPTEKLFPFWGKAVFDDWVSMSDCKYDTLKKDKQGDPIFLDGSMAMGGEDWKRLGNEWSEKKTLLLKSPYLKGVVDDSRRFRPWIENLEKFLPSDAAEIFCPIPASWRIEEAHLESAERHFSQTSEIFVPALKSGIERSINSGWS